MIKIKFLESKNDETYEREEYQLSEVISDKDGEVSPRSRSKKKGIKLPNLRLKLRKKMLKGN